MKECTDIAHLLDDFLDGELTEEDAARVAAHIDVCANCQAEYRAIRDVKSAVNALPRSIEPEGPVWSRIEAEIQPISPASFGNWLRQRAGAMGYAAGVAAAVVLIASIGLSYLEPPTDAGADRMTTQSAADSAAYDIERDTLRAVYVEHVDRLDPELRKVADENLAIIDQSVQDIRAALDEHPEDPVLERMLFAAVRSEADMLQQIMAQIES